MAMNYGLDSARAGSSTVQSSTGLAGEPYKHAETTRLLCAAAYLNRSVREFLLESFRDNRHRAVGPNYGVDMPTVLRHCKCAHRKLNKQEILLLLLDLGLLLAVGLVEADSIPVVLIFGYLVAFGICFWSSLLARSIAIQFFRRGRFNPDALIQDYEDDGSAAEACEDGNVLVYSGFTPFVGSGLNIGGWSFALDLRKEQSGQQDINPFRVQEPNRPISIDSRDPHSFDIGALYGRIAHDIQQLSLDRVSIEDRLYVNGRDIRDDKRFLENPLARPKSQVPPEFLASAMLDPTEKKFRHYRCVRVVDWSGELVLSIFLRCTNLSHNLFVEASYFLLCPVGEGFRSVDSLGTHFSVKRAINVALMTAISAPFLAIFAPLILFSKGVKAIDRWSARRKEREEILNNPNFDYGASFSARQWASPNEYRRYFQKLDKEMYLKVLEKNILDSILTFLEENNIDVSELRQRQSIILNNGVIMSGGSMNAENVSVGIGATVENVKQKIAGVVPPKAAAGKQAS